VKVALPETGKSQRTSGRRFGIGAQMYLGIGGAVSLTVASGLIAFAAFWHLSHIGDTLIRQRIPSLVVVQHLSRQSTAISADAPKLVAADHEEERLQISGRLEAYYATVENLVTELKSTIGDSETLDEIGRIGREISTTLQALDRAVESRLVLEDRLSRKEAAISELHREILEALEPVLDDALFYLVTGYRDGDDAPIPLSERLSVDSLLHYQNLEQMEGQANLMASLLSETAGIESSAYIQPLKERFDSAAIAMRRALRHADGRIEMRDLPTMIRRLISYGEGTGALFKLREQVLRTEAESHALWDRDRHLDTQLGKQVAKLLTDTEAQVDEARNDAERTILLGRVVLALIIAASLVGSILLAWLYVGRHLLRRLTSLAGSMRTMAGGDLTVPVERAGNDEVTDMAEALEVFRRHALEVQRLNLVEKLANELREKNAALQGALEQLQSANARTENELAVARSMQAAILPSPLPEHASYDGDASMIPARQMGGDFYDIFFLDDRHLAMVIGDVSGKGVPAAFFMAICWATVRQLARTEPDPCRCIAKVNNALCSQNPLELFVTMFFAVLDTGTGRMTYVDGGHNPSLLVNADAGIELLKGDKGVALGVIPDLDYRSTEVMLGPGDILFLYTDGITEAMDPDLNEYGTARLASFLASHRMQSAGELLTDLLQDIRGFAGEEPQSDDITCVAIRYQGTGGWGMSDAAKPCRAMLAPDPSSG
jgi:serine phosphatase RsbU (regulator of sigma subunit)